MVDLKIKLSSYRFFSQSHLAFAPFLKMKEKKNNQMLIELLSETGEAEERRLQRLHWFSLEGLSPR